MYRDAELSTRKIVLSLLRTRGPLSVGELAKELGITEMAVRRHLNTLDRDGFIESKLARQAMGRPLHMYSLTKEADDLFPKKYNALTLDLLEELVAEEGEGKLTRLFQRRKDKLSERYGSRMEGKSFSEKVAELARIQNDNGYMVSLEQGENGDYILNEHNCPIAQVADQYQQACQCELALFQELLETPVERTECLAKGGTKCVYQIRRAESF
ncbi:helix-turn-helix transcriptional regulator [Paenibacillus chitinolyticus]|uniref:helix-turn-helix transcriptional regulator n=1 Tax=Paenibacillus chitinolyticus TaxID=79263 RepID=UPI001C43D150|nr:metalloregulator ArsR/SmtB family transcription factor [Paenibacillus chitinolyticus]MBV6714250.1 transcriptional regulator [Paenibacillus chitinolyticus]